MVKKRVAKHTKPVVSPRATAANSTVSPSDGNQVVMLEMLARIQEKVEAQPIAPFCTFLSTLGHEQVAVVKNIPITVRPDGGESFIASFLDAGISFSGPTIPSAVRNLQSALAESYLMLADLDENRLGPKMQRERRVLLEFLCRT